MNPYMRDEVLDMVDEEVMNPDEAGFMLGYLGEEDDI